MKHEVNGRECKDESCWCKSLNKCNIDFIDESWNDHSADGVPYWDWDKQDELWKKRTEDWDDNNYWTKIDDPLCPDMVKEPAHYKLIDGKIEAIDLIKDVLTREEFLGYLRGTLIAYHLRANRKNGEEDLRKADIYNNWLIEELDNENS